MNITVFSALSVLVFFTFVWGLSFTFKKVENVNAKNPTLLKIIFSGLFLINLSNVFWLGEVPWYQEALGLIALLCSLGLFEWAHRTSKRSLTLAFSMDTPIHILKEGPYAHVRHPFYVAYFLFFLSFVALNPGVLSIASFLTIFILYTFAAETEEQKFQNSPLRKQYALYSANVGRFFPTFSKGNQTVKDIYRVDRSYYVRTLFQEWFCIAVCMGLAIEHGSWWGYVLAAAATGIFQHRLALLAHDAAHGVISKNQTLNDLMGNLSFFYPIGCTVSGYREFHAIHHTHTNTAEDPEITSGIRPTSPNGVRGLLKGFILDCIGFAIPDTLKKARAIKDPKAWKQALATAYVVAFVVGFWALGLPQVPVMWFLGFLTVCSALMNLRELTEHTNAKMTQRMHVNVFLRAVLFPHNTWCHYEHHKLPRVPSSKLTAARMYFDDPEPVINFVEMIRSVAPQKH